VNRRVIVSSLAALALAGVHASATAQVSRPGLWEVDVETSGVASSIPPDALAKMQERGISVPTGPRTIKVPHCVTPEEAARNDLTPPTRPDDKCQPRNTVKTASSISLEMVCEGKFKGTGSVKGVRDSDTSYHGSMDMTGTMTGPDGTPHPVDVHSKFSGHWVSADCGSTAPSGAK
jgi:hypothetical protein